MPRSMLFSAELSSHAGSYGYTFGVVPANALAILRKWSAQYNLVLGPPGPWACRRDLALATSSC